MRFQCFGLYYKVAFICLWRYAHCFHKWQPSNSFLTLMDGETSEQWTFTRHAKEIKEHDTLYKGRERCVGCQGPLILFSVASVFCRRGRTHKGQQLVTLSVLITLVEMTLGASQIYYLVISYVKCSKWKYTYIRTVCTFWMESGE